MAEEATKKCPFCGEVILAEAIKCRFCKEFLVDKDGVPVSYHDRRIQPPTQTQEAQVREQPGFRPLRRVETAAPHPRQPERMLFEGAPSLWGLAGLYATMMAVILVGAFLLFFPIGAAIGKLIAGADENVLLWIDRVTGIIGIVLMLSAAARAAWRTLELKRICYEVTSDRIEFARGIFSRKIDNIDLFRVVDIKLHRSILDCLTGVGTVTLQTKDETDPTFQFEKIADPKALYDVIKKASLTADRRQGVIHVD